MVNYLMKQSFEPGLLGIFVNPFYFIRKGLFKGIVRNRSYLHGDMLDFGCGRKPYKRLINVNKYVGVDLEISGHSHENSQIDVFYDGSAIPFANESFDSFLCSEVFEHLFNLEKIIEELHRVLKVGGTGLITVPFVWPEHEIPYDYGRYTSFGMKSLLERKGFKIVSMEKTGHFIECLFQLLAFYINRIYNSKFAPLNLFFNILLISPINVLGLIISNILPRRRELFFNLVIVVKK